MANKKQVQKGEGPGFRPGLLEPRVPIAKFGFRRQLDFARLIVLSQAMTKDEKNIMLREAHDRVNGFLKEYPILKYLFLATAVAIIVWGCITPI